jgi:ABC-2 type transport system ATP-binding protein
MLTTLLKPTSGRALVAGYDVVKDPKMVRHRIGVIPQAPTTDLDLTAWENMNIYGKFYGIPEALRRQRIGHLLDVIGLRERAHDLVATYSGGMRRRLEIARGLVHMPSILFLDEPSTGLDPQSRRVIWDILEKLREERLTMVLTTHYMEEAESLCDRVAIIDYGKTLVIDSPDTLKENTPGQDIIQMGVDNMDTRVMEALKSLDFVRSLTHENQQIQLSVDDGPEAIPILIEKMNRIGVKVQSISLRKRSLEDVFIHYTGRSIREERAKKVSMLIGAGVPQKYGG